MPVTWRDLESAFLASDPRRDAHTWIHAETSEVRFSFDDTAGGDPPPENEEGWHLLSDPRDLDLKQRLVWDFVDRTCPALSDDVHRCFSRRGGWRAYKDLLERRGFLDHWHTFEDAATRRALLAWTAEQGLVVVDPPAEQQPGPSETGE